MAGTFSVDKGTSDVVTRTRFVVPTDPLSLPLLFNLLSSIESAMYWGRNMLPYWVGNRPCLSDLPLLSSWCHHFLWNFNLCFAWKLVELLHYHSLILALSTPFSCDSKRPFPLGSSEVCTIAVVFNTFVKLLSSIACHSWISLLDSAFNKKLWNCCQFCSTYSLFEIA